MQTAQRLVDEVRAKRPDLYEAILRKIQPHKLEAVLRLFEAHLHTVDLDLFNRHRNRIPDFVWAFVRHLRFPVPGDPFGIFLTCRITKSDTQGTLDSKHLQSSLDSRVSERFNVNKPILDELDLFSTQIQVFEMANNHGYATVFLRDIGVRELLETIPESGHLERGGDTNMCRNSLGQSKYVNTFRFLVVEHRGGLKVLYQTSRDLYLLLRYVPLEKIVAFSDIRAIFEKCGIVSYFFNMLEIVRRQLWVNDGSVYEKDMTTIIKYQCRSGTPLPLTRDGLAKNPNRSPIDVLSFEAPKKNYARFSTRPDRNAWHDVKTSSEKIFFGQQFNEGTGYEFALMPDNREEKSGRARDEAGIVRQVDAGSSDKGGDGLRARTEKINVG